MSSDQMAKRPVLQRLGGFSRPIQMAYCHTIHAILVYNHRVKDHMRL
jgi:hypothetical protein